MIIRRKPLGIQSLRKPRTIGLSLLHDNVQRLQQLAVRRMPQAQGNEPINWGETFSEEPVGYPAEIGADVPIVDAELLAEDVAPETEFGDIEQEASQPPRRT